MTIQPIAATTACACARRAALFANPIVYHLIVDRFCRDADLAGQACARSDAGFHGGSFNGIVARIEDGWFARLGVNTLLISSPVEQIAGWIPAPGGTQQYHAYHGYWPLDFTVVDRRLGTESDFDALVAAAHAHGLNVVLDLVLGHVGYQDLQTLARYRPDCVAPGWQAATPADYRSHLLAGDDAHGLWGEWIDAARASDQTSRLPQLALERRVAALPVHLQHKPGTRAVAKHDATVGDYLVDWAAYWVHARGVDGFRCDSAAHVPLAMWQRLKAAAAGAPQHAACQHGCDAAGRFWMTGEVYGHGIEVDAYFAHGFDSLLNFAFQPEIAQLMALQEHGAEFGSEIYHRRIDKLYARYAARIHATPHASMLSYISSHDTVLFERRYLRRAMTALLLAPGGVLVLYGDECGRLPGDASPSDPAQATRSPLDWHALDLDLLRHCRALGQFRARHACIAQGAHRRLGIHPYAFARVLDGDATIVVLDAGAGATIDAGGVFAEGTALLDAYTGARTRVVGGRIAVDHGDIALLARAGDLP